MRMDLRTPAVVVAGALVGSCSSQGLSQQTFMDVFQQAPQGMVDILFVVDDSQSMNQEQLDIAESFVRFINQIEETNTDWQVGVVTTDMVDADKRGRLQEVPIDPQNPDSTPVRIVTPLVPNYNEVFSRLVHVGIDGSKLERGLDAARSALTAPLITHENEGFLRADAGLAIVILSDENDCSDGGAIPGNQSDDCSAHTDLLTPVTDYVSVFRGLKADSSKVVFSAIIGNEGSDEEGACPETYPGRRYREVAELMGGMVFKICDPFDDIMDTLGLSVSGQRDRFELSHVAAEETIEVEVTPETGEPYIVPRRGDDDLDGSGWTYDSETNFIIFWNDMIPDRGSTITVTYRISSGPLTVTHN